MFRVVIAALAAAALSSPARAESKDAKIADPEVAAKSATAKEIAGVIAEKGLVRVLVVVAPSSGATLQAVSDAAGAASTREATKQLVATTLDGILSAHKLSHVGGAPGAPAVVRLSTVPAFSAVVDGAELTALAKDPRVVSVEYDRPMQKHLAVTLPLIGMPAVHTAGGTGAGFAVAVIDDGIQRDHVFVGLSRLYPGREACILDTNSCPNGSNQMIGTGASAGAPAASHGMHTSGIVLGNRASGTPNKGVAPAAKLVPINIFGPNTTTSQATILRAFEHVEDLVLLSGGTNPLKIASINMSVGGGASAGICDSDPQMALLKPVIDRLRAKGVLPVVSAGNDSKTGEMSFPSCLSTIVSVAATSRTGVVSSYTNISPSTDLFAPGGEFGACVISSVPTNTFGSKCGTSMAAPHVAGAAAALKKLFPTTTACRIEDALKSTGLLTSDTRDGGTLTKPLIRVNHARLRLATPVAPSNNNFASAFVIPANAWQYTKEASNVYATLETGEATYVGSGNNRSVWFKWTPSASGPVTIDTIGSGFNTVLAVFRGAASAASRGTTVASNDDISATVKQSRVAFNAVAGTTYHIVVAGRTAAEECSITLNVKRPPTNDNFAAARAIGLPLGSAVGLSASNVGATKQAGEPNLAGDAATTSTVWFRFTPPETDLITIDTIGSEIDTVLAVYRGSAINALTQVAVNDDIADGDRQSRVRFQMVAGTQYYIQLGGWHGAEGRYRLWLTPVGAQSLDRSKVSLGE